MIGLLTSWRYMKTNLLIVLLSSLFGLGVSSMIVRTIPCVLPSTELHLGCRSKTLNLIEEEDEE